MIARISGKLVQKQDHSLIVNVHGVFYEIVVPSFVLERIDETKDAEGNIHLVIYHYFQIGPSSGIPMLIGFINEIEKDFFLQFIKVSGIGPRAAVRALDKPISQITRAIHEGDIDHLKTLPGIGIQRAKEIVAKLQGKMGKFGLIQDKEGRTLQPKQPADWQEEALDVLLQLQYKRHEAKEMIEKTLKRSQAIKTAEELLNEIYNQRVRPD
ncbi:MAG: Holliday junction DNA helicase RuvA [Candidatus Omnitrophica bacterium]|nr:Holliday junction DNA helicase RuvA [Candidatus Omnitrophota bacterium]MBI5023642.1 Holliday junction DNA helicase RuvA [Candidatus Omnitrophota bacterium]